MIRFLFYIIIFSLGLAAAAFWFGEMRHLRKAAPDRLPEWSQSIAQDARLAKGSASIAQPNIVVNWRATAPVREGLTWAIQASGPGLALEAQATLPWWPKIAKITGGRGTIDPTALLGSGDGTAIRIISVTGEVPLMDRSRQVGFLDLELAEGTALPPAISDHPLVQFDAETRRLRVPVALP